MEELLLHQVEVHQQWEEVLHLQEEALQLIEEVLILEIVILLTGDHHLIQIIEHQPQQIEVQDHPLQIQGVVLHLQEVLEQVALVKDHLLLHHHLEEETNLIFRRKFQKIWKNFLYQQFLYSLHSQHFHNL